MPRRPSKGPKKNAGPRPTKRSESKIKKWRTADEIPMDEEDQFHANRDQIFLDSDHGNNEDSENDEEVFALEGISSDDEYDGEGEAVEQIHQPSQGAESSKVKTSKRKRREKTPGVSDSASEEEDETWGSRKAEYYSTNDANSDDEEANALEVQEAMRLQSRARDAMQDGDFGIGDQVVQETIQADDEVPSTTALPTDPTELLQHIAKVSPESLALAQDWEDTAFNLVKVKNKIERMESEHRSADILGMVHLHYQTLITYATLLAFYLHLRTQQQYSLKPELLKRHPIFSRLLVLKKALATLEDNDFAADSSGEDEEELYSEEDSELGPDGDFGQISWSQLAKLGVSSTELEDLAALSREEEEPISIEKTPDSPRPKKKRKKDSRKSPSGDDDDAVFDLVEPSYELAQKRKSSSRPNEEYSQPDEFGEASTLLHADAADKSAKRKSLRFYTHRIDSTSARRKGARLDASGGDDDLPYREKKKKLGAEKTAKAKAALGQGGDDLDDMEPTEPQESENGYYDLVKQQSAERKKQKKEEYTTALAAVKADLYRDDAADGQRGVTRAILKNKGLTPRRSKEVRNPRVKKRLKFEKAKRKVASQKAIYKGGIGDVSKYGGETSGISRVVKSTRLS